MNKHPQLNKFVGTEIPSLIDANNIDLIDNDLSGSTSIFFLRA